MPHKAAAATGEDDGLGDIDTREVNPAETDGREPPVSASAGPGGGKGPALTISTLSGSRLGHTGQLAPGGSGAGAPDGWQRQNHTLWISSFRLGRWRSQSTDCELSPIPGTLRVAEGWDVCTPANPTAGQSVQLRPFCPPGGLPCPEAAVATLVTAVEQ